MGVRVQVEDAQGVQFPARFAEPGKVTGEGCGIAGDVPDGTRTGSRYLVDYSPARAGARRIQKYDVEPSFAGPQDTVHPALHHFDLTGGEKVLASIPACPG